MKHSRAHMVTLAVLLLGVSYAEGYDLAVHELMSQRSSEHSEIRSTLTEHLGLRQDPGKLDILDKALAGRTIKQWISYGGQAEDYGKKGEDDFRTSRSFNHFHDPLLSWDDSGFDSVLNAIYWYAYGASPVSSILWALNPGQQNLVRTATGDWSWPKAREYFFVYLTGKALSGGQVATTEEERNSYLADCFRALGQVIHLLQDMSVPAHTRNDPHIFPLTKNPFTGQAYGTPIGRWTYETYTSRNAGQLNYAPHYPNPVVLRTPNPESPYSHLRATSGLFDRNKYDGDSLPANNDEIGLAEYSNANFLSEDTIWSYPHPSLDDTNCYSIDWLNPEQIDAEDGKIDNRVYVKKVVGERIDHLAAADYWSFEDWSLWDFGASIPARFSLDELCWKDYAEKLVPRAVGYSAALLDYFFRGKIEISDAQLGYNRTRRDIDSISLRARNVTENDEAMTDGTIDIVIRHKNWYEQDYRYNVTQFGGASSIPRNQSAGFVVYLTEPIPMDITDAQVFVVFKGKLGLENGGIGVGFKEVLSILVNEEWDNGLAGNHSWQHMSGGQESGAGVATNSVSNDIFFKSNLRYVGRQGACYNESYLSLVDGANPQGILVRPDTFVHFRIPRMDINQIPPAPPGETTNWQALNLMFNNGYRVQFSRPGQVMDYGPKTAHYYFDPSFMIVENIYDLFQGAGISISEPLYLEAIDFIQQLFDLEAPSTIAHRQQMEVDFIRIIGWK